MTDHNREEREALIEAFKSRASEWDAYDFDTDWDYSPEAGVLADIALAVFEQAHTPTSDEREALVNAITKTRVDAPNLYGGADGKWPLWDAGDEEPELIADSVIAAGFRRTVQGEPANATEASDVLHSSAEMQQNMQGEPTFEASETSLGKFGRAVAARFAGPVQGEPTDPNQIPDEVADAAQIAMHEFCFGDEEPVGRLSVARQGWKVALAAAAAVREEGQTDVE